MQRKFPVQPIANRERLPIHTSACSPFPPHPTHTIDNRIFNTGSIFVESRFGKLVGNLFFCILYTYSDSPTLAECSSAILNQSLVYTLTCIRLKRRGLQYHNIVANKNIHFLKVQFHNILGVPYHYYVTCIDGTVISCSG